ncbi:AlkZ-related protein [Paenibacillus camelliae]|uniref:AlkZ-related protein n=1 Tax=Paenibacillus camelliae TaxID=512410 RepID=UPI00203A4BC6|nr:hypothetical protein [Paenibacillus camelliae]MCM3633668.1 hypothetical protein [Paenibacillus camelliae]
MPPISYEQFIQLVEKYKIFPFSEFVPEYPSLTVAAASNDWHTDQESDPWLWRVRIVQDGIAAYGKFFGSKATFIHAPAFPLVRTILTSNRDVRKRYNDGLMSRTAYQLYNIISEHNIIDSRRLRKEAGLGAKEDKKEYEKSLVELQNSGDIVITGAVKQNEDVEGWSSMCYQPSELWLNSLHINEANLSAEEAKQLLSAQLIENCSTKAYRYFAKKLQLDAGK